MKSALLIATLLLAPAALHAQREVPPADYVQPGPKDVVIAGNKLQQTVQCDGNSVYIQGERNEVQINGRCENIRVQGNGNYAWVQRNTVVNVEGNENTLFFTNPDTRYSNRGNGNRYERAKH